MSEILSSGDESFSRLLSLYEDDKILFLSRLRLMSMACLENLIENLQKIELIVQFVSESNPNLSHQQQLASYEDFLEEIVLERLVREQIIKTEGAYHVRTEDIEDKACGAFS